MRLHSRITRSLAVALLISPWTHAVLAHSASDAYLTLTGLQAGGSEGAVAHSTQRIVAHGQWDIALRDLDFVLGLDDNGDGNIVWGELRRHQPDVTKYAYTFLHTSANGKDCSIVPTRQMVDNHADGAYAALFFDIVCAAGPSKLTLDYKIFFAIDPSHRGILVMHSGDKIATAVLSPQNAHIDLAL